jgi:hypothetical protein
MWPALARLAVFSAAVAVAADGRIACQMATGPDGVRALVTALLTRIATDGTVPSAGNAV